MSLSAADVQRIATLARLQLSGDAADRTLTQLNQVFELIEQLKAVDTHGVVPMTHATDLVLREDGLDETGEREGRALSRTTGLVEGDTAQIADEFLGEFAEGVGFVSHGAEFAARLRRGGCSGRRRRTQS